MKKIIGLCGFISSGKDTVADYLTTNLQDPIARIPGIGASRVFGTQAAILLQPMDKVGRAGSAVQRLMSRPLWILALAAASLVVKPRRLVAWSGPLLAVWRLWRGVKGASRR